MSGVVAQSVSSDLSELRAAHDMKGLYKIGGGAFIASGVLFLSRHLLELAAGAPPSSGADILAWVASHKIVLSFVNEILFFATVLLVPAVVALYHSLVNIDRTKTVIGCGIIAAVIPVLAILLVVHGRLVYPIYGIVVDTPAVAAFAVAVFYGGLHAAGLMFAIATFVLSLAMRRAVYGKGIAYLGFVTTMFDIMGSYPDAIGPILALVCQVFFTAWFVAVGSTLYRMR